MEAPGQLPTRGAKGSPVGEKEGAGEQAPLSTSSVKDGLGYSGD